MSSASAPRSRSRRPRPAPGWDARHGLPRAWPVAAPEDFRPCWAALVRVYVAAVAQAGGAQAQGVFMRLDRGESMRLLTSAPAGRLIFTINALPAVRLMNFAVADGLILLRMAAGTTVARKVHDVIVAFEADELDAATSSGWSVVVTGRAMRVTEPDADRPVPGSAPGTVGTRRMRPVRDDHDRSGGGPPGPPAGKLHRSGPRPRPAARRRRRG